MIEFYTPITDNLALINAIIFWPFCGIQMLMNTHYVYMPSISGSLEELVAHGLRALRDTLPSEINLTTKVNF